MNLFDDSAYAEPDPDRDYAARTPHARAGDPTTSHAAAVALEANEGRTGDVRAGSAKHVALSLIGAFPKTANGLERITERRGIWKRVSDLKRAGLVEADRTVVDPETGRDVTVWKITPAGERVLDELGSRLS